MDIGSLGSNFISLHDNPSDFKDFPMVLMVTGFYAILIEFATSRGLTTAEMNSRSTHILFYRPYMCNIPIACFSNLPFVPVCR